MASITSVRMVSMLSWSEGSVIAVLKYRCRTKAASGRSLRLMGKGPCMAWLAATGAALLCLPAAAHGATAQQVIASINGQRSASGLPAGITENSDWSASCGHHNDYEHAH